MKINDLTIARLSKREIKYYLEMIEHSIEYLETKYLNRVAMKIKFSEYDKMNRDFKSLFYNVLDLIMKENKPKAISKLVEYEKEFQF